MGGILKKIGIINYKKILQDEKNINGEYKCTTFKSVLPVLLGRRNKYLWMKQHTTQKTNGKPSLYKRPSPCFTNALYSSITSQ